MQLLTKDCLSIITSRPQKSHKGTFGRVLLIGGNQQYGGAILMAAEACVKAGAGLVTVATDPKNHTALHARLPEAMVLDWQDSQSLNTLFEAADVCLIGPGLGLAQESQSLLSFVLHQQRKEQWLILDGSAITLFAEQPIPMRYPEHIVFTPHQMEWQRLSGLPLEQPTFQRNKQLQQQLTSILVLKSPHTQIYSTEGSFQNLLGNPGMATGGMGDTLAGIIAGFLAQFPKSVQTVNAAVYLHSYIGDQLAQKQYVVLPTEISHALPYWMKRFAAPS